MLLWRTYLRERKGGKRKKRREEGAHVETVTDLFPGMYPAVESHRPATVGSRHSTTLNETMLRADAQASQAPY